MGGSNDEGRLSIFISYASEDYHTVQEISQLLKENYFFPWIDKEELLGGEFWNEKIEEKIRSSDVIIICFSKASVLKEGYFQREIKYSLEVEKEKPSGKVYIIPVRLEECKIPNNLKNKQFINYFEKDGFITLLKTLEKQNYHAIFSENKFGTIKIPTKGTICTDDYCYAPWSESSGGEIAVRLTPIRYPMIVNKVKFYITCDQEPWSKFKVHIYDSKDFKPSNRLDHNDIIGEDGNGDNWVVIDISKHKIIINKGDFFVSMVWLTPPGTKGEHAQCIGGQINLDSPGKTFFKFSMDGTWWLKNRINCMIRAIDSDGNEMVP